MVELQYILVEEINKVTLITPEVVIALSMYALCTPHKFSDVAFETQMEKQK